jgi:hypothetical protein
MEKILKDNEKEKNVRADNIFQTTRFYNELKVIRDDFYKLVSEEPSIKKFIKDEKLDLKKTEDRLKIKEKLDFIAKKNDVSLVKIKPKNEKLENASFEEFEKIVE